MPRVIEARSLGHLSDIARKNEWVIVDFAAESWCVPCQRLKPHFDALSDKLPDFAFVHVDMDGADPDIIEHFSIASVPQVHLFTDGTIDRWWSLTGRTAPALIRELDLLTDPSQLV